MSLAVTASPDLIVRDGSAQSTIKVRAFNSQGQVLPSQTLRVDVEVGGVLGDLGTLSARTVTTLSDGTASVTYTAPPPAMFGTPNEATIKVVARPINSSADFANSHSTGVTIKLVSPGVILPPNGSPVPSFFMSPSAPHERESVRFDGSASTDPDGLIVSYAWDFGDGDTAPPSSSPIATHHYDIAAVYQPTLTVTDDRGLSVRSAPVAITVVAALNPTALFVYSPTPVVHGVAVNFNGSASTVPTGRQLQSWQWDFGDGTTSTTSVPTTTHIFTVAGTYTVLLTVTDDIGRTATVSVNIIVS